MMKPNKYRLDTLDKIVKDTIEARRKIIKPFYAYKAKMWARNSKLLKYLCR